MPTIAQLVFFAQCRKYDIPAPVAEYKFHLTRKWKIDYAFPCFKLAVEIEGGAWTQGRHTRGSGFVADMEKYNALAVMGWRLLRFTPSSIDYRMIAECVKCSQTGDSTV